ncbi:unnamed protein product [Dovyalis caffra]|uniref:Clathrin light chain n=1 Tax=Dovyalis caffra TaxID=77055 RepID=A0AAV1SH78_9ROSI|nr:unnamed protein product [Dovyalis caffra]
MASSFDSFNPEGDLNDPTMQHVQHDHVPPTSLPFDDDGYIGDDTSSFPGETPLPQESFSNDNNMHSSEGYGFGMPSPSTEFASPFESEVLETNGGGGGGDGVFASDGPILPEPDEMQELGVKFREWRSSSLDSSKLDVLTAAAAEGEEAAAAADGEQAAETEPATA